SSFLSLQRLRAPSAVVIGLLYLLKIQTIDLGRRIGRELLDGVRPGFGEVDFKLRGERQAVVVECPRPEKNQVGACDEVDESFPLPASYQQEDGEDSNR